MDSQLPPLSVIPHPLQSGDRIRHLVLSKSVPVSDPSRRESSMLSRRSPVSECRNLTQQRQVEIQISVFFILILTDYCVIM